LEYKKGESQTNIEITKETDWNKILQIEEEQVKAMCEKILEFKPDLVITEKGVSGNQKAPNCKLIVDLAQHYFVKANVTALRRVRKTDNNRIARAVGATIVNRVEDIRESDVGVGCGLFHIEKIGDECVPALEQSLISDTLHFLPPVIILKHAPSCYGDPQKTSSTKLNEIFKTQCLLRETYTSIPVYVPVAGQRKWQSQSVLQKRPRLFPESWLGHTNLSPRQWKSFLVL
jgi:hypothetical protein